MAVNMQGLIEEEQKVVQPLAYFLRQKMEVETRRRRWVKFKERLGCWGLLAIARRVTSVVDHEDQSGEELNLNQSQYQGGRNPGWVSLAMALAAERELRAVQQQPLRVSLIRLMEEAEEVEMEEGKGCCVCMVRRKGAAFIPCGHTFCRTCARKVWIGRGSCPLCNTKILEILHIF